jgi:hypothetical protein
MEEDFTLKSLAESASVGIAYYNYLTMRRFERELEALRKELAEAQNKSHHSSPTTGPSSETESEPVSPIIGGNLLGGEEGTQPEVFVHGNGSLSLALEENKKDR